MLAGGSIGTRLIGPWPIAPTYGCRSLHCRWWPSRSTHHRPELRKRRRRGPYSLATPTRVRALVIKNFRVWLDRSIFLSGNQTLLMTNGQTVHGFVGEETVDWRSRMGFPFVRQWAKASPSVQM
jgi:hypothetical protein